MITIKYRKYRNEYIQSDETASFRTLKELQDWIFDKPKGDYNEFNIHFTDPDKSPLDDLHSNGSIHSRDKTTCTSYWVNTIYLDGGIIYSDGRNTGGIKYWNDMSKQFLRDCIARKNNPASAYNFV